MISLQKSRENLLLLIFDLKRRLTKLMSTIQQLILLLKNAFSKWFMRFSEVYAVYVVYVCGLWWFMQFSDTRYILGVLTNTTAWDQHWGVDETLRLVLVYVSQLPLFLLLISPRGLVVTKNVYFSLLTHTNQLLLVTLCHTPTGIGNSKVGRDVTPPTPY